MRRWGLIDVRDIEVNCLATYWYTPQTAHNHDTFLYLFHITSQSPSSLRDLLLDTGGASAGFSGDIDWSLN